MTDTTTTTTQSREVVERYIAAIADGDEQGVRDAFAEDATWWLHGDLPIAGTWTGRDTILTDFLGAAQGYFRPGSIDVELTNLVAEGDEVVAEWTSRARTANGDRAYENFCIGHFTVRDGRIQAVREYMDTLYAHQVVFGD